MFSSIEEATVAVKKNMQTKTNFFDQSIAKLIPGTSIAFTVEIYKEEIGKSFSKIYLYLCNVGNVDSDVNVKVIDENEVTIHSN